MIIQVFQLFNDILDYQIEKLGFHFDNPGFSTYCTKQVENLGLSNEKLGFSTDNLGFSTDKLGFSTDKLGSSIQFVQ